MAEVVNLTVKANADLSEVSSKVESLKKDFQQLKLPKNLDSNLVSNVEKVTTLIKKYQDQLNKGFNNKADAKALASLSKEINSVLKDIKKDIDGINNKPIILKADATQLDNLRSKIETLKKDFNEALQKGLGDSAAPFEVLLNGVGRAKSIQNFATQAKQALEVGDIKAYDTAISSLINKVQNFQPQTLKSIIKALFPDQDVSKINETKKLLDLIMPTLEALQSKGQSVGSVTKDLADKLQKAQAELNNFNTEAINKGRASIEGMNRGAESSVQTFSRLSQEVNDTAVATAKMKGQVDQLKSSTEYFFSLRNMIGLLRRGINQAIQTVSELDKAMTQTAVVTEFSVGDMWSKLPLYTEQANKLGSTIKDVYEATTLYYQQGLDTNQAIGLANETLKMARIAGMEAAEATDAMTAALRGFNMEINELSAQRINDVYSEIAAKTASDTEELSTAMTKTASLAHSAGMSFEGTTAFLAQMIETTREAPENLGTAMKTIIARFQEMKKNPLEIVDVEGEEVSYNKIDEALQSIGVSLKDANGQFRNLDEVFLEISSKWDSLTQTQQRYIATTAAGSRQQSRFIAMMSNYERVTQLVDYANHSAGASQEQFGKTLESFEAKVNKLKNAWQEYLMGIADNTIIKKAIDLLTGGLTKVNKIIDTLSGNSSGLKSVLSIFTGFMGLKAGGRIVNALIGGLGGMIDPRSSFGKGFFGGGATGRAIEQSTAQAKQISTPIVNKLSAILDAIHQIKPSTISPDNPTASQQKLHTYKESFKALRGDNLTMGSAADLFNGLNEREQLSLLNNTGGTKLQMQRASANWFKNLPLDEAARKTGLRIQKEIWHSMSKGNITAQEGFKLLGNPQEWGERFGDEEAQAVSKKFSEVLQKRQLDARKGAQRQLGFKGLTDEEFNEALKNENVKKQYDKLYRNNLNKGLPGLETQILGQRTALESLANKAGVVGSAFTQAGFAVSSFGSILKRVGGPVGEIGGLLESVGGTVASLGMGISGLATIIPKIAGAIGAWPLAIIIAGLTAAATLFGIHQQKVKDIHEAAQKVVEDYQQINKATTDNIAALKEYKDELSELSKGVDENGYNVNLSTEEYDRYLDIVDKIAEINPEIVKYYNAQGHAVLDLNNALEDTLDLEEKRQKEALRTYTSQTSLQQLLDERSINKDWKKYTNTSKDKYTRDASGNWQITGGESIRGRTGVAVNKLKEAGFDLSKLQSRYGIKVDSLLKGESAAIQAFTKNQDKILREAEVSLANNWDTVGDGITNAFTELGNAIKDFNTINQPIFEQLATWIGQDNRFQNLGAEQKGFVTAGLQSIVMEDLDAPTMRKEARKVVREIDRQFGEGSPYEDIMSRVKKAQEAFALDLDETKYKTEIGKLTAELETLKKESEKIGGAAGEALSNAYTRELDILSDQAGNSAKDILEALNPLSDELTQAEGAFAKFEESSRKDFSTASKNMKQFFDILDDETHKAGYGDQSFWLAAKNVFNEKSLKNKTKPSELKALQDSISPMFEDGAEGFNSFVDYINKFKDNKVVKKFLFNDKGQIQFDFDDENIHEIAEALKLSDNSFTALLNKARQFAKINFNNTDELRESLALSDTTILGKSKKKGGQGNLYVNREQIIQDAYDSGSIANPQQEAEFLKELKDAGIVTVPGPGSLTEKDFKDWGKDSGFKDLGSWIKSFKEQTGIGNGKQGLSDAIAIFDKMGYNKKDIYDYTQALFQGKNQPTAQEFNDVYDAYVEEQNLDPVVEGLSGIDANVEAIKQLIAGGDVAAGDLNPERVQAKNLTKETFGGKGTDSMAEFFAKGMDAHGDVLSEENYTKNKEVLEGYLEVANQYLQDLTDGQALVEEGTEKFELYQTEIDTIGTYLETLSNVLDEGIKTHDKQRSKESKQELDKTFNTEGAIETNQVREQKEVTQTIKYQNDFEESDRGYESHKKAIEKKPITLPVEAETVSVEEALEDNKKKAEKQKAVQEIDADITEAQAELEKLEREENQLRQELELPYEFDMDESDIAVAKQQLDQVQSKITAIRNSLQNLVSQRWNITITDSTNKAAKGLNNYISTSGFYTGSMAGGSSRGTLGPKGKGGLTLTGEKGFEVAWLPSENRSMIVGARGPQMVDLPSNAVVWDHEQSKKIIKQKGIPIGSMANGDSDVTSGIIAKWPDDPIDVVVVDNKSKDKDKNKDKDSTTKNSKAPHTDWLKVEIDRFNLNQKINKITEKIEKQAQKIDDALDKVGTTYNDIVKNIRKENTYISNNIKAQKELKRTYDRGLKDADSGKRKLWVGIQSKNDKGEWESNDKHINIGKYIKKQNGVYTVDRDKITKDYDSKVNQEAVFNAIQSELDKLVSGSTNAAKAIEDLKNKRKELNKKLAETFYLWENELTKVYQLTNEINVATSKRSRYENELALQLARLNAGYQSTANAIKNMNTFQSMELDSIRNKIKLQKQLIIAQKEELASSMNFAAQIKEQRDILNDKDSTKAERYAAQTRLDALKVANKYMSYTKNQDGTYNIEIDYEKLAKDKNNGKVSEETYNVLKDIYDTAIENETTLEESFADLSEAMTEPYEMVREYQETLAGLEDKLMDALEKTAQKEIDKLTALNNSLTNAAKKIIDQVKKTIDARRRAEDNAKTENDIVKKQQRLAALRANTSGGNQVEIAQLEKEIADAQQSYGRTLEDQMLSDMQTQADEAAKQRQEQIDIAKQQLEWNKANGVLASQVNELIAKIDTKEGQKAIREALKDNDVIETFWAGQIKKEDLDTTIAEAVTANSGIAGVDHFIKSEDFQAIKDWVIRQDKKSDDENKSDLRKQANIANEVIAKAEQEAKSKKEKAKKKVLEAQNNLKIADKSGDKKAIKKAEQNLKKAKDNLANVIKEGEEGIAQAKEDYAGSTHAKDILNSLPASTLKKPENIKKLQRGLNTLIEDNQITGVKKIGKIGGEYGPRTIAAVKALQEKLGVKQTGKWNKTTSEALKKHKYLKYYKQGGLARSTGPAWLDGTPTKPEIVLNAQDTKNFMALRDVLSGVMHDISHMDTTNTYNSPTEINVNVNVEKIANDYDVDQMIARVKKDIVKDAGYRNVTMVRRIR